jgi:hypothetical protein
MALRLAADPPAGGVGRGSGCMRGSLLAWPRRLLAPPPAGRGGRSLAPGPESCLDHANQGVRARAGVHHRRRSRVESAARRCGGARAAPQPPLRIPSMVPARQRGWLRVAQRGPGAARARRNRPAPASVAAHRFDHAPDHRVHPVSGSFTRRSPTTLQPPTAEGEQRESERPERPRRGAGVLRLPCRAVGREPLSGTRDPVLFDVRQPPEPVTPGRARPGRGSVGAAA